MPRRIVDIGTTRFTRVVAVDEPGAGGANHRYFVEASEDRDSNGPYELAEVIFAEGPFPAGSAPITGLFNEDLLAMVLDRLQAWNAGPFKSRENAIAITKIEEAMLWLGKRTADRARRAVLGKNEP